MIVDVEDFDNPGADDSWEGRLLEMGYFGLAIGTVNERVFDLYDLIVEERNRKTNERLAEDMKRPVLS